MTDIYVDGDACPVREEIYRVAARLRLDVYVVSNGSRPVRPPGALNVHMVLVGDSGNALAGREIARHLRELGMNTRGPPPLTKKDRSRFLSALSAGHRPLDFVRRAAGLSDRVASGS